MTSQDLTSYLDKAYARVFIREIGGWSASVREFRECYAVGVTLDETMKNRSRAGRRTLVSVQAGHIRADI